jgi:uncharacterized membrane protein YbaN (DUF454 family)
MRVTGRHSTDESEYMSRFRVRRALLVSAGVVCVGFGTVGVFVPLLPTTPFLLLAAACFIRSSDRLYLWLIHHRWFGSYIRNYREHRAITLGAKIVSLTLLWGAIGFSAVYVVRAWWLRVLLGVVAVGVTIHLLRLRTLTREMILSAQSAKGGMPAPGVTDLR